MCLCLDNRYNTFMEDKERRDNVQKTLYNASYGEIFWKNFLAGLGHGLGGLLVHLIFFVVSIVLVTYFVLPQLEPFITSLTDITNSFKTLSEPQQLNIGQFLRQ